MSGMVFHIFMKPRVPREAMAEVIMSNPKNGLTEMIRIILDARRLDKFTGFDPVPREVTGFYVSADY